MSRANEVDEMGLVLWKALFEELPTIPSNAKSLMARRKASAQREKQRERRPNRAR